MSEVKKHSRKYFVIMPAAGAGLRFGGVMPKQFIKIADKALWQYAYELFLTDERLEKIVLAVPESEVARMQTEHMHARLSIVAGGKSRAESVRAGLEALGIMKDADVVLVHDAVRPQLTRELVDRILSATDKADAVVPAILVTDTIKEVDADGFVMRTPARSSLRAVQTPQAFHVGILRAAYRQLGGDLEKYTDEAMLVEACGGRVLCVAGDPENIKITNQVDKRNVEMKWGVKQ